EHPNLRAALSWHLEQGDAEQGLRLASALAWFWSSRGHFREASQWFEAFLAMPTTALTRGRGLVDAANILHWQGDDDQAMAYADEALAICQAHGDQLFTLYALRRLASLAIDREELDRAAAFLAESDELVRSVGSAWDAAFTIFLSGRLASAAEKSDEAVGRFAEAAEAFRAIGDRGYVAAALGQQGAASLRIGALPAAAAAYAESLELAHALKDQPWVAWASVGAAHLAHDAGESAIAARLLGAATAIREAIGERRLPKSALDREVRSTLGEEQFVSEWSHGMRMSETEVVAEARIILGSDGFQPLAQVRHGPAQESTLTPREQEVLRLLVAGHADKEIAAALAISRTTVSRHVAAIRAKLDAPSRGAAVAIAVRDRLI
ncbi:MAG: response regulator transcription factor, partial [Thermomicrobiales bacterium]